MTTKSKVRDPRFVVLSARKFEHPNGRKGEVVWGAYRWKDGNTEGVVLTTNWDRNGNRSTHEEVGTAWTYQVQIDGFLVAGFKST